MCISYIYIVYFINTGISYNLIACMSFKCRMHLKWAFSFATRQKGGPMSLYNFLKGQIVCPAIM